MSTVIEAVETDQDLKTPPPRPPPPMLFPDPIPNAEIPTIPDEILDESEAKIVASEHNPKLYKLIQMSNDESFDMDDADPTLQNSRNFFSSQKSSSFWWDNDNENEPFDEHFEFDKFADPFPSHISTTVYAKKGT